MNLGFDIDGVISDFVTTFIKLVHEKYGVTLTEEEIYCHDLNLVLGITKKERNGLITETLKQDLPLNKGAKETIEKLSSEGHKIYLLTARFDALAKVTNDWLKRKGIPYTELLQLTEGEKYLANINLDIVVEDCLQDALEWSQKVKTILMYDHPWNKTLNVNNLIKRVYSWDEIYEEIQRLKASSIGVPSLIR
jgi:uncharacterized HAD superfamily protein